MTDVNWWTAPPRGKPLVTITATNDQCTKSIFPMVVEPYDFQMRRNDAYPMIHRVNTPSVGMRLNIYLLPDDVSFFNVETIEEECGADDTGIYQYMTDKGHYPTTIPIPYSMEVVSGLGTKASWPWVDRIYSGFPGGMPPPYGDSDPGSRIWDIPSGFRVVGTQEWVFVKQVRQQHTLAADKVTLTCTKAGGDSPAISVYDPTSGF